MVPRFERRVIAFSIDISALAITMLLVGLGIQGKLGLKYLLVLLVFILTSIVPLILSKGQTFGKRIQGIKVVNLDDSNTNTYVLILRELFKMILSISTFGIYSLVCYFALTEKGKSRTIHDYIFKTKVISTLKRDVKKREEHFLGTSESLKKKGL